MLALLVTSFATTTAAGPPRPGEELNGLTPNETATLWSRDSDAYITQAEYEQRYGDSRSSMAQVANGTDITFKQPPRTAATWTRHDFQDLAPGNESTSVHPPDANLKDGRFIVDAHASIFAIHPSTRAHRSPGETPLYIAPTGTVRGLIDYRIRTGNASNGTILSHHVEDVRLLVDGREVNATSNTKTPELSYELQDTARVSVRLEADITARVQSPGNASGRVNASVETETVTVGDSMPVTVYDLSAKRYTARYPSGESGVAVFQSLPWQGYTLSGRDRVRGVWRFYTARDTTWDTLIQRTARGETKTTSPALPVYVHAYPSRIGPRAEPVRTGPEIVDVWGPTKTNPSYGSSIDVDGVDEPYTASYGVAIRTHHTNPDAFRVAGIVRGVNASIDQPDSGATRQLRNSTLTASIHTQSPKQATIRLELRDTATGDPIALQDSPRTAPIDENARSGYLVVNGQRVTTNSTGVAVVTLDEPGVYTVRYVPGSWLDHDPAYVGDTATVRWHPLTTLTGWLTLLTTALWYLTPFLVTYYAGHRIHRFFTTPHHQ